MISYRDQLIIMPWQIDATQGVYLRYTSEGRLPWHTSEIPEQVRNASNTYRRVANHELERAAANIATDLQMPNKANIDENEAAGLGLHRAVGGKNMLPGPGATARLAPLKIGTTGKAGSGRRRARRKKR